MSNVGPGSATKKDRADLLFLINRKLNGAQRQEAAVFVRRCTRSGALRNLEQRLLLLPDLTEQRNTLLSPEQVLQIVESKERGATLQELAEQYGCSHVTIWRALRKWAEQERLAEQSEQREPEHEAPQ